MITVYVWPPALTGFSNDITDAYFEKVGEFERSVGHSSLQIDLNNGEREYLSFWPAPEKKEIRLLIRAMLPIKAKCSDSYEYDRAAMRPSNEVGMSAKVVRISGLNEIKMCDFISKVKSEVKTEKRSYNLYYQNCSTLVAQALQIGADKGFMDNMKSYASHIGRAADFASTIAMMYRGLMPTEQKRTEHFSSLRSIYSSSAAIGLQTPVSVLEYANSLKGR